MGSYTKQQKLGKRRTLSSKRKNRRNVILKVWRKRLHNVLPSTTTPDDNSVREKKTRKAISLETKIQILDRLAAGEGSTSLGKHFGLNEATVRTIKKNEGAIRKSVISGTKLGAKSSSYTRDIVKVKMEKALVMWIEDCSQKEIALDGNVIKQKALELYKQIQEKEPTTSNNNCDFSASTGWLTNFLKRYALRDVKVKVEPVSADEPTASELLLKLSEIIENGDYTPDQVWNADETSLFWKKMPSRTYVRKSQKSAGRFKVAEDRATLLFCSNASGDCILKPLFINRSLRPQAMKGVHFNKLPVHWKANKKCWLTKEMFNEWFHQCFVPEVEHYLTQKDLDFKVLLIIGNALCHSDLEHPNVQFCFLPPNTTSLVQPLDQGVIATFKTYYIRRTFQYILNELYKDHSLTIIDVWKTFSILDCIKLVDLAVSELKPSTLNACWEVIWPKCVNRGSDVSLNTEYSSEYPNIIRLARAVGGEGFDDFSSADIDEMMVDKVVGDDEIIKAVLENLDEKGKSNDDDDDDDEEIPFAAAIIKEGLQMANKLESHFLIHDPNTERAEQFKRELKSCMARYEELYKDLIKTESQPIIAEFVMVKTEANVSPLQHEQDDQSVSSDENNLNLNSYKRMRIKSENDDE